MIPRRGVFILIFLLLLIGIWEFYRARNSGEALEMESPLPSRGTLVFLGEGFPEKGIHQFYDDPTPQSVIHMTLPGIASIAVDSTLLNSSLRSGEGLELFSENGQIVEIKRFWIPSEQRMALFIPLHPDRMSRRDWEALPGIGPGLAERIEKNRQKNGDFGCLESLERIKGIGEKRIQKLKKYF
jgi:competence protein ComEA